MILQSFYRHAQDAGLLDSMDVDKRVVHLVLNLRDNGEIAAEAPWTPRYSQAVGAAKKKPSLGAPLKLPAFPGVNSGGKAYFLADGCDKVLGLNAKTGEPIADDGSNAAKAFRHFWERIEDAHEATKSPSLHSLLLFRDRYLIDPETRGQLPICGVVPFGRQGKPTFAAMTGDEPIPLEKQTITFQVGASRGPIFQADKAIRDYWRETFHRERFDESSKTGVCLVTGQPNQPIAEVHRTLIKGVPGLPPIGGYVVSFDDSTHSLSSYGMRRGWNAPISEEAAAVYALGLNNILANRRASRRFGKAVLCAWIPGEEELTERFDDWLNTPTDKAIEDLFVHFERGGKFFQGLDALQFFSMTLAANGGRIVVRRWLNEPLRLAVTSLKHWFDDLAIEPIVRFEKSAAKTKKAPPPYSIASLAGTTARILSEVQDPAFDALHRAALEGWADEPNRRFAPLRLLVPALHRLRIAAAEAGNAVRFHTSRFALIKLILVRSETPMSVTRHLCETADAPYNCGRLLALLDDLQYQAQGRVGADIVARFYGNASMFPQNVFHRLLRLEKHHRAKLRKVAERPRQLAGLAIGREIDDVIALFPPAYPDGPPQFPRQLTPLEQGRFALGFHQQKAQRDRAIKEARERRAAGQTISETQDAVLTVEDNPIVTDDAD